MDKKNVNDLMPTSSDLVHPFEGQTKDEPLVFIYSHNGFELYQRPDWAESQLAQLEQMEYLTEGGLIH